jgi:hypothetical protein
VLFANEARPADFAALLASGAWPDFQPRQTVLLEASAAARNTGARRPGTSSIRSYANTEVAIDADSPDGGWVVLNDVWQQWWFATVDGVDVPVLRANVLFRAVEVPPGRHAVRFTFRPLRGAWSELRRTLRAR